MDVYFQMRFSYCGKPDGLINRRKKSNVLTEDEILRKFELLERLTLPSLREQEDPSFKLLLLTSARMPEDCKSHLTWLMNQYLPGRSEIIYARPMVPGRVFRHHMQGLVPSNDPVIQTQVLDGDAFGVNFVRTLRDHAIENWSAGQASNDTSKAKGTFMSFKRGFYLKLADKTPTGLEAISNPVKPFGLSLVARASGRYNPELINPDVLGVKLPYAAIRTRSIHCMRAVSGEEARNMPAIDSRTLANARQDFSVLGTACRVFTTHEPHSTATAMHIESAVNLRQAS